MGMKKMVSTSAKPLIIRINLFFLAFFIVVYGTLLLCPSASDDRHRAASLVRCSLLDCHHKSESGTMMVLEDSVAGGKAKPRRELIKREIPSFLSSVGRGMKIGMINMEDEDVSSWSGSGEIIPVTLEKVPAELEWKSIFPAWIDEEEEYSGARCPEIPMPDWEGYGYVDVVVAKLPCQKPEKGWSRDVFRMQVHLAVANMAVRRGRQERDGRAKVVVLSKYPPMPEFFRCEEVAEREGQWWFYRPEMRRLEQKVSLPVGSCELALPLWDKGSINERYDVSKVEAIILKSQKKEAYVTLTDYDKVIFIDADIILLRNIDVLFHFPQMSATGNDAHIFNSGIMVIEPSNCTFRLLMRRRKEITSYNGGDQGFLNEVFVWWHRLPRRINFLKNFPSNSSVEAAVKNQLFGSDPPKLYSIHYLGLKPWLCYKDYDCNWDVADQHVYASDHAHRRWWKVHDAMSGDLQRFCRLSGRRKIELEWNRKVAGELGFEDQHWRINVTDPRKFI
ncbi:UDP-glucuronate:xylan alpha-glucuronosyltransferase 2-like isoform X1 [Salvia divinorum]|uniref:UDP-glucuronate:xylan alpha-glucuronosyltransferase 2-like isoform X1 n=1 Tax=Salvia divinorum TaxID=28513 RepID=A0ABD1GB34_SALDI